MNNKYWFDYKHARTERQTDRDTDSINDKNKTNNNEKKHRAHQQAETKKTLYRLLSYWPCKGNIKHFFLLLQMAHLKKMFKSILHTSLGRYNLLTWRVLQLMCTLSQRTSGMASYVTTATQDARAPSRHAQEWLSRSRALSNPQVPAFPKRL